VTNILKIVSGQDAGTLDIIARVYEMVVEAGIYRAPTIKTAEAAKVIENTQRDLNIALVNELAMVFDRMGVDTGDVLDAASTKWNFIRMSPGLVGGHCIGVDPYYLTYKADELGYHPHVILAGRRINDGMGKYVAEKTVKQLIQVDKVVKHARVLVLGITFKENVSDIRNSRVIDVIRELEDYGLEVTVTDPFADPEEVRGEYGIDLEPFSEDRCFDGIVIAVNHDRFRKWLTPETISKILGGDNGSGVVIDVKSLLDRDLFRNSGVLYWRL
jgi:UDP-N-acetyl-D-galactosamine dehydrogenase